MRRLSTLLLVLAGAALSLSAQFAITTTTLPPALLGQPYPAVALDTVNDVGPFVWTFTVAGPAPSGFVVGQAQLNSQGAFCYGFNTQNGPPLCTGTVQTFPGVYTFTVQATSLSTNQVATRQLTIAVIQPLQLLTTTLPDAAANLPYSFQILTRGGTGNFLWTIPFGTLPSGITLDPATGLLSGTAPNVTALYTFTVQVQDTITHAIAALQYTLNISGGIAISTAVLPNAFVGQPYSFQLEQIGSTAPVWIIQVGGVLPPQFSLSSGGLLTGFGVATGTYTIPIQLKDTVTQVTTVRAFPFNITLGPLHIMESAIPAANQNIAYHTALTASGGIPPYHWSFDIPSPQSMSIGSTTGNISGTPPNAGTFDLPVSLKDATGAVFSESFALSVLPAVSITTTTLANGLPGVSYQDAVAVTGGSLPYRFSVSIGSLPPGLSLNAASGQITGIPATSGIFPFTVQVIDSLAGTATKNFTITIGAGQLLTITTTSLPDGAVNQVYSQTLASSGGTAPFTWSLSSGSLPTGLSLNAATGAISGTPSILGNFAFDIVVTDVNTASARKSFAINITGSPLSVTSGNFSGVVLAAFSQTLGATGGTPPYTWSSGTLPAGLSLNAATGVISGTPSAAGTTQLTVTVTDSRTQTAAKNISIAITLPATPTVSISLGTSTQPAITVTTSAAYPLDITGVLTLAFVSSVGGTDDMVRFSNTARTITFTVPANTTQATFQPANPAIITGTVAGSITLTASLSAGGQDITPSPAPVKTITTSSAVPVISSVTLQQVTGGLSVVVSGYSNTRGISSGAFTFTVSSGNTLSQATITVPLASAFTTWFSSTTANATGGQFRLTVPFSVTGSATAVTKVTVTLTNSVGTSVSASSP